MNHRYQLPDPGQGGHQIVVGPVTKTMNPFHVALPGLLAVQQTLIDAVTRQVGAAFGHRQQGVHLPNPLDLSGPGGTQLVEPTFFSRVSTPSAQPPKLPSAGCSSPSTWAMATAMLSSGSCPSAA